MRIICFPVSTVIHRHSISRKHQQSGLSSKSKWKETNISKVNIWINLKTYLFVHCLNSDIGCVNISTGSVVTYLSNLLSVIHLGVFQKYDKTLHIQKFIYDIFPLTVPFFTFLLCWWYSDFDIAQSHFYFQTFV